MINSTSNISAIIAAIIAAAADDIKTCLCPNGRCTARICPSLAALCAAAGRTAVLEEEAERWYLADGSFINLPPDEVIKKRMAAARQLATLAATQKSEKVGELVEEIEKIISEITPTHLLTHYWPRIYSALTALKVELTEVKAKLESATRMLTDRDPVNIEILKEFINAVPGAWDYAQKTAHKVLAAETALRLLGCRKGENGWERPVYNCIACEIFYKNHMHGSRQGQAFELIATATSEQRECGT